MRPFEDALAGFVGSRRAGAVSSGSAAFYLALRVLAARSERKDVVLPAYTAPVLLLPVLKAGLRPVFADISLETFNAGTERICELTGGDTLAVVPVHMFGIPCAMERIRAAAKASGAAVIEDAASALGARIGSKPVGTLGDVGFFSFHRGKQLTTLLGGAWVTDDDGLADAMAAESAGLRRPSRAERAALFVRLAGLALAVRPWFYTMFRRLLAGFKDTEPHKDFALSAYTAVQAGVGLSLLRRIEVIVEARNARATRARALLGAANAVMLPRIAPDVRPSFNHCPILLSDRRTRDRALAAALGVGVECTTLYDRTVYEAYNLKADEYGGGRCLRAEDFAGRLLVIPCHPLVPMARIEQVAEVIGRAAS